MNKSSAKLDAGVTRYLIALFLVFCVDKTLQASEDLITGIWSINANNYTGLLKITSVNKVYVGDIYYDVYKKWERLESVELSGDTLRFYRPEAKQHYEAKLSDNGLVGTFTYKGGSYSWYSMGHESGDSNSTTSSKSKKTYEGEVICYPQCTDYVNDELSLSHHVGAAKHWWESPPLGYSKNRNGLSNKIPKINDIIVWDKVAGSGHVAIVENVDRHNKTITIRDSNWSPNWKTDCNVRHRVLVLKENEGLIDIKAEQGKQGASPVGWLSK